jgi:hydroxymethylglutaryl-CoA reductase
MADELSFRRMDPAERLRHVGIAIDSSTVDTFLHRHPPLELADQWIENAIGYFSLPIGVIDHLVIDGIPRRVPLATEETSIIAAASACAKWIRSHGEITTERRGSEGIGQIQFPRVESPFRAREILVGRTEEILALANVCVPGLVTRGGGFTRIDIRLVEDMVIVHLYCDTCDAMGANLINQACEAVAPELETWIGSPVGLRILSNLVDTRRASATIRLSAIEDGLAKRIEDASRFAEADPYRAATHNKGIMNGIDGVVIATGNDWRAVEAGAHAFASRSGVYRPLSIWRSASPGVLFGTIDLPMAIGTVGGVTRTHPTAAACLRMIGAESSSDLARIIAGVGLVQNLAALRALASDGIVAGHMRLHLKNLILASEAKEDERMPLLARLEVRLRERRRISSADVREFLTDLRTGAIISRTSSNATSEPY